MDLSKAFDTLNYDLLIATLPGYGFSEESLQLIQCYLTSRWQRTKVNASFSNWTELILGVPQGLFLGSYSLIYICVYIYIYIYIYVCINEDIY